MKNLNLVMSFKNAGGKTSTITLKNVRADLTKLEIEAAMNIILENNIFVTPLGDLVSSQGAELVEKIVTELL